jgi:hypothetical protein
MLLEVHDCLVGKTENSAVAVSDDVPIVQGHQRRKDRQFLSIHDPYLESTNNPNPQLQIPQEDSHVFALKYPAIGTPKFVSLQGAEMVNHASPKPKPSTFQPNDRHLLQINRELYEFQLSKTRFNVGQPCQCGRAALVACADCQFQFFCLDCFEKSHATVSLAVHNFALPCLDCGRLSGSMVYCSTCAKPVRSCPECLLRHPHHTRKFHLPDTQFIDLYSIFPRLQKFLPSTNESQSTLKKHDFADEDENAEENENGNAFEFSPQDLLLPSGLVCLSPAAQTFSLRSQRNQVCHCQLIR